MNSSEQIQKILYNEVQRLLGFEEDRVITSTDIVQNYLSNNVPHNTITCLYIGMNQIQRENQTLLSHEDVFWRTQDGYAITKFIHEELAQEHPTDKRFLLRAVENMCKRHGLNSHKCPGYGHDILFSFTPIPYSKFDNSLYIPPKEGYWAIVSKSQTARD